jgi:hypothetical protein
MKRLMQRLYERGCSRGSGNSVALNSDVSYDELCSIFQNVESFILSTRQVDVDVLYSIHP